MRSVIIGFALGILLLQQQASLWGWSLLMALACFAVVIFSSYHRIQQASLRSAVMVLAGAMVGWVWASGFALVGLSDQLSPEMEERDIAVIGVVAGLPSQVEHGWRFPFSIERVLTPNVNRNDLPNKVMLNWYITDASANRAANSAGIIEPGERWQLKLRLRRPHGLANPHGFDVEVWMLEHGFGASGTVKNDVANQRLTGFVFSIKNSVEWAREKLRHRILTALPNQPYASVLVALVIGEQNAITPGDWKVFARTGVSHLIAISGLHVTLISGMFASVMFYLWRHSFFTEYELPLIVPAQKVAALSGVLIALLYVALAGFGLPAQRTLIMISVAAGARWFDRITSVTNVLCLALGLVLLVDPWAVLSPGFWLSYGAVGFLFFVSLGRREIQDDEQVAFIPKSTKSQFVHKLRHASMTQYAITLGLLPLTMLLFNQVSLVSPIANAVAIPLVSLFITPCALLGSVLPAVLGGWVLSMTHSLLQGLIVVLSWLSQTEWAVWQLPRPDMWMFLSALIGTFWCLAPKGWPLRWAGLLAWLPLCLNKSVYPLANAYAVTALDVGQGMAVLVETAHHRLLYDTGPSYSGESDAGSKVIYPYLKMRGINELDGLIISHSDNDHSGGAVTIMQQLRVGWVSSSLAPESRVVQTAQNRSSHTLCMAGQVWEWDGVRFEVLHPDPVIYSSEKWKPNAKSCTLKISNGTRSILLAGDIEAIQEDELINSVPDKLQANVLLAPHHGSGTSSTTEFLRQVHPEVAIFQLGYHNRYHHPKPLIWQRYADLGIVRYRSDQAGAIAVNFGDGTGNDAENEMRVDEYRVSHARYWYTSRND